MKPLWIPLLLAGAAGCAGSYRLDDTHISKLPPSQVISLRWQMKLVRHNIMDFRPQEWSSAAIDQRGTIFIGSSAGKLMAVRGVDGKKLWQLKVNGGISSKPLYHGPSSTLFFGADDGRLHAVDARTGVQRWSYATKGTIKSCPVYAEGTLLFTSSEGRLYALDAKTGEWRWQYDREIPEGFTIHGYAGVAVKGRVAFTGFADGTLVALKIHSGDVLWTRSLSGGSNRFMDVDSTPVVAGEQLLATSYASGVYALSPDTGSIMWQYPVEGASNLAVYKRTVFFSAPKQGLVALDLTGRSRWRQAIAKGVPSMPVLSGPYLFLTGTESGIYAASARTGALLQYFNPGHGISAEVTVGGNTRVVLSNYGWLFVFEIKPPLKPALG